MDNYSTLLRDLHTYLLRIQSLGEELEAGPQRLKRLQNRINAAEKALADHQAALKAIKVAIHQDEVSLKANAEQIKKYKKDVDSITSKKEYDALNVEIAALEKRTSDLEDEALQKMSQSEELAAKTPELEQAVAQAKLELAKGQADQQEHLAGLQARLDEAKKLTAEKIEELPDEWKKTFRRLESTEGADALAALRGRSCSACYTDVTAQQLALINAGNINTCKNCGKILYVPE
jgi:predicted  nucleic acid-binding Zn-ribbon protein